MTDVNIWGDAKKELDTYKSKNYVGYIPSNYENYGFNIFVSRHVCNVDSQSAEEPYELDVLGHSEYEFHIICPDSVKLWKFSYKLSNVANILRNPIYPLKYILKGSSDNSNWITFYNSIVRERIFTPEELNERPVRVYTKSIFPNILIENPKSYKYYIFSVTIYNPISTERCIDIDSSLKGVVISNPQMYIMND